MAIFKNYIEYIKNNPNHYWFKRKLYGWGWTPVTWQGWLVIAIFLAYLCWNEWVLLQSVEPVTGPLAWFFAKTFLAILILFFVCYKKGQKPKWQWGIPKEDSFVDGKSK